jgi:hypothetical protein
MSTVRLWLRAFIAAGLVTMIFAVMAAALFGLDVYVTWLIFWSLMVIYAAGAEARRARRGRH